MPIAVILAAGHGTRMASALPKAMHPIAGQPMLCRLLAQCAPIFSSIVVVLGPDMAALAALAAPHAVVVQHDRRGTAHAALQAAGLFGEGDVVVLFADNPLIGRPTLQRLLTARADAHADLALLTMLPPQPERYGRVLQQDGRVTRIVEYVDATEDQRAIGLCNAGGFCANAADLRRWLQDVQPSPGGEQYLPDIVPMARHAIAVMVPYAEARGINTRAELAQAEASVQQALRAAALDAGATLTAPETVFFSHDTTVARDTSIGPHVVFGPGVHLDEGCTIRAFSHLEGCTVGLGAVIGPYARLRPGTVVEARAHVGNFVELKATRLGAGAKANHLSYIGDADVGAGSNIGAGTITCNYDGIAKHRTSIGTEVFIGSSSTLVAPLSIGDRAFIAAGSVITAPVEADALAFGRARQEVKPGMGARLRQWLRDKADANTGASDQGHG